MFSGERAAPSSHHLFILFTIPNSSTPGPLLDPGAEVHPEGAGLRRVLRSV